MAKKRRLRWLIPSKEYRKTKLVVAVTAGAVASIWLMPIAAVGIGAATLIAENKLDE